MKIKEPMRIPKNRFAHFDWLMTIVVVCCSIWGLFIIYSATHNTTSNPWSYLKTQGTAFVIGMVALFIVALFDYEHYESLVKYIYAANVFLLILVLIIGTGENIGSKSWIRFGGFGFQPAEIVKVGFIITFSFHLSKIKNEVNSWKNLLFMLLHVGILVGLVMLQPDAGTAASFLIIFLFMVFMAGLSYKYLAGAFGAAIMAMEGDGPTSGTPREIGAILASQSPYELDLAAIHMVGISEEEALTVKESLEQGLTPPYDELTITGDSIDSFAISNFKRARGGDISFLKRINLPDSLTQKINRAATARPVFDKKICVGCGECARCCPPKAIELIDHFPQVNFDKCIHCFCCQELCPQKAVTAKRNFIFDKLFRI